MLGAIQNLRYSETTIETLYREMRLIEDTPLSHRGRPLPLETALRFEGVSFRYSDAESDALREVSLSIPRGASVGFIGESGAGKSTLVDIMLGLFAPTAGRVCVDGIDIQTNLRGWQDQIGYVPQSIFLTDDTLRRNIAFGLPNDQIDDHAVWRAIEAAKLDRFVNDLPQGVDTLVGERGVRLSGGQKQRIGIARALYNDPAVLVLDEATSSLDAHTEQGVMKAVRASKGDKTLIIVAHRISTVEHCDRLFRLEHGELTTQGSAGAVLAKVTEVDSSRGSPLGSP